MLIKPSLVKPSLKEILKYGKIGFTYDCEIRDKKGKVLWREKCENILPYEGWDIIFTAGIASANSGNSTVATTASYLGLINNANFGSLQLTDTATKITTSTPNPPTTNSWAEFTGYSNATRLGILQWTNSALGTFSASTITAGAAISFTINASGSIFGVFATWSSTKGGTTSQIFSEAGFSSAQTVTNGNAFVVNSISINEKVC